MIYTADTHALIWFLTEDDKLGEEARTIFKKAEEGKAIILITTISLMEILYICKKKGVVNEFKELLKKLRYSLNYVVFDLNLEIVLRTVELEKVDEMHDRIIVATAKTVNSIVITKDLNITESGYVPIIW